MASKLPNPVQAFVDVDVASGATYEAVSFGIIARTQAVYCGVSVMLSCELLALLVEEHDLALTDTSEF